MKKSFKWMVMILLLGVVVGGAGTLAIFCKKTVTPIAPVVITAPPVSEFSPYTVVVCGKERHFETREEWDEWVSNLDTWAKENCPPEVVTRIRTRTVDRVVTERDTVFLDPSCPCQFPGTFRRAQQWRVALNLGDARFVALDEAVISTYVQQSGWMFQPAMEWGAITLEMPAIEIREKEPRIPGWAKGAGLIVAGAAAGYLIYKLRDDDPGESPKEQVIDYAGTPR